MSKEEMAKVAAKWWRQRADNPKFDNGSDDRASVRAGMMATKLCVAPTEEQLDKFEAALVEKILADMERCPSYLCIMVDYGPCLQLCDALEAAGIEPGTMTLPWKTHMYIRPDKIEVAEGYGAYNVTIWENGREVGREADAA